MVVQPNIHFLKQFFRLPGGSKNGKKLVPGGVFLGRIELQLVGLNTVVFSVDLSKF